MEKLSQKTKCCIVGGGPAGMMLAYLLVRSGIQVTVLEKHGDFLRDFRGDTVHPSTLQLMHELGILDEFLKRPHQKVFQLGAQIGDEFVTLVDFSYLPTKCKYIALMPQWDFLNFLVEKAKFYPSFGLQMNTEAVGLIEESGRIVGVNARTANGDIRIYADLVIGADGRHSTIRQAANLEVQDLGAPMDVLWFRLSRKDTDPPQTLGRVQAGLIFIMLNRGDYWQCGFVIPKGTIDKMHEAGLDAFRARIKKIATFTFDRIDEVESWDQVKLLTVKVDRLKTWHRPGLLCIGDSAHAMSPIGGVGINLAIQDAVATANLISDQLVHGVCSERYLAKVQARRIFSTITTQSLQVFLQNIFVKPTLESSQPIKMPEVMQLFNNVTILRAIPAFLFGNGLRPEHIKINSVANTSTPSSVQTNV